MEYRIIDVGADGSSIIATVEITLNEYIKVTAVFNMDELNQKINEFTKD